MATAAPKTHRLRLGPRSAGLLITPAEFDRARFQEGWRYELISGVLVWIIDRFRRSLTVYRFTGEKDEELRIPEDQTYETPLLPGFVLPLKGLLALADRWAKKRRK